ncbi:hypothetical protein FXO37_13202 [Capsicum annuum]|nr:hypothetical protein FXO37_13202 [Capsicum annuum]
MVETTKVSARLVVMYVLDMASQATRSDIILNQVLRVSIIIPQLSSIARISRVPLPVPPVGSSQIDSMLFSPNKIRKILLTWSLRSDPCEKSFQELKTLLITALILTLPDGSDEFMVYCDASRVSLGSKPASEKVVGVIETLEHDRSLPFGKSNIVADSLSRMSMGSVAHMEDNKKKLVQEVHQNSRLGVRLVNSAEGSVKIEHQKPSNSMQEFSIPTWKWEKVNMDFEMATQEQTLGLLISRANLQEQPISFHKVKHPGLMRCSTCQLRNHRSCLEHLPDESDSSSCLCPWHDTDTLPTGVTVYLTMYNPLQCTLYNPLDRHVYKKSSSNYERPSQEDNQAYEDESNGDSDDVNESDNPDNINASDSDPDGCGGSGSGSGSGSGATVGANDAPLEIFETIKHYDYDHTSFTDFAPLSECSACKCQNYKAKYNGVINAINTLTTSVKELTSNSGVILSKMISYPYTSLEIKAARRRRKEFSKALSSIEKRKIATPPFL